jgi:hypothetical protein
MNILKNMKALIMIFSLFVFSNSVNAAPIPATGSSPFAQALKNTLQADEFRVGTFNQEFWELSPQLNFNPARKNAWHFQGIKQNNTARFAVHIDHLTNSMDLKQYVKKWIKEYPYLGFEILATNSMQIDGRPAFVVDLSNKVKNKQLRQFVVQNKEKNMAVVMTCTDIRPKFLSTIEKCHEIVKNFQWSASSSSKSLSR